MWSRGLFLFQQRQTTANDAFARLQQRISLVGTCELRSEWLLGGRIQRQVWITGGTEIKVPPLPTSHISRNILIGIVKTLDGKINSTLICLH